MTLNLNKVYHDTNNRVEQLFIKFTLFKHEIIVFISNSIYYSLDLKSTPINLTKLTGADFFI